MEGNEILLGWLIYFIIILALVILTIYVPIYIATKRNISGSELATVKILSWCGLLMGITWFIALVLSLVYQPAKWIDKENEDNNDKTYNPIKNSKTNSGLNIDKLEKLYQLKEKGILTDDEYNEQKRNILGI